MSDNTNFDQDNEYPHTLEDMLLLYSVSLDLLKIERIFDAAHSSINWSHLLQKSTQQGVFPLCWKRFKQLAEKRIISEELSIWKDAERDSIQKNIRLSWKLMQCIELKSASGIDSLVLKGPAIAIQAYGDLYQRQFSDLDILIHPKDFEKAYQVLVRNGYQPIINLDKKQIHFLLRTDNHFSFSWQGDIFEIHWDVGPKENVHSLSASEMWKGIISLHLNEKDIWTLSGKNTILYLCMHGAKHAWYQLKWIVDLAYLCRQLSEKALLDILIHAKQYGFYRQVCLGLFLAEDLVDLELPGMIKEAINTNAPAQSLVRQVKRYLFSESSTLTQYESYLFYLRTRERWQERFHYLVDILFRPKTPDWLSISFPERLYFLYFLYRPFRLICMLVKSITSAKYRGKQ